MDDYIAKYMQIIEKKEALWKKTRPKGSKVETYLDGIMDEVEEVREEIKDKNSVYLEDELGDIFWDYLNVLFCLQKEGKITSRQKVFARSFDKFSERIEDQCKSGGKRDGVRDETKQRQKKRLLEEHNAMYPDIE